VLLGDAIAPGAEAFVQLVLERPIAAAAHDRFVLRDTTAQRTIAGGRFLDLRAPTRKRRAPERLAQLEACAIAEPQAALVALLDRAPWHTDLVAFARDRALGITDIDAMAADGAIIRVAGSALGLSPATWLRLKRALIATIETFHKGNPDLAGMGVERLRVALEPRLPAPAFAALLQSLARAHEVALDGAWVKLPSHAVRLTPPDEKLWSGIHPLLGAAGRFRPPRVREIAGQLEVPDVDVRRLLKLLGRMGKVDEVAPDHFFLRDTVAEMVEIAADVAAHAEKHAFIAAQFRDRLDNGRKVAIQILEFFDRHGVTVRRGDLRRMNPHRLDLFRRRADDPAPSIGREASPVGRPDFKSGRGREPVLGGFDSLSLPPRSNTR
jgi:selenocysteine-specific elongation factor